MRKDYGDLILNCLEAQTFLTFGEILEEVEKQLRKSGTEEQRVAENTLRYHLKRLEEQGKIKHQKEGYVIDRGWKEGTPKAFILIELAQQKRGGEDYQKKLVDEIHDGFRRGDHKGLNLISVDIVLGAEFSLIVQVYSDDLHFIGRFVKGYLLTHELVMKTHTIMVWPTEPRSPA